MMVDTMNVFRAQILFLQDFLAFYKGSSDTTFYVITVYFGIGIKNTRYTVGAMLLADLVGITVSILMALIFRLKES